MALRRFLFMSSEGFYEEQAWSDEAKFLKITGAPALAGDVVFDAASGLISNLATPVASGDAATKGYVDSVAQGLDVKDAVEAVSIANIATLSGLATTVDDVALSSDGMRVLLTAQTDAKQNGIWVVHSGAWTRPTDFAAGQDAHSDFVYAIGGTSWTGSGWVCINAAGAGIIGTDELDFTQFSGAQNVTASHGLVMVGNDVQAKAGDGLKLTDTTNEFLEVDLTADGGLQLTGTSPNKTLGVKVNTAAGLQLDANGIGVDLGTDPGLEFSVDGLEAKIYASGGLKKDANGLSVFQNAAGYSLQIDSNGVLVTSAPALVKKMTAAGAVAMGACVYVGGSNTVSQASSSADATARVLGVAMESIADTMQGKVCSQGLCPGVLVGATPNTPYYLAPDGTLTTAAGVTASKRNICIGYAYSATDLWVDIKDYGKKAA